MKKIGMFISDKGAINLDFRRSEFGNPGIGGTQYEFYLLAALLAKIEKYSIVIYHLNSNIVPKGCSDIIVKDIHEAIKRASELEHVDIFICQANIAGTTYSLDKYKLKAIFWAHNFIRPNKIRSLAKCKYVSSIVCVGKFQYWITRCFCRRTELIYNMIPYMEKVREKPTNHHVTYIGSIVPPKGFHVLAKAWKNILASVPDAELYVIGGANLYDKKMNEEKTDYEIECEGYLSENGRLLDAVHFLGNMGDEKNDIILNTCVGVVNPSRVRETFGIAALDFSNLGVPVVGNMPTIKNKKTGFRIKQPEKLSKDIVVLLNDTKLNVKFGMNGKYFLCPKFYPDKIMPLWLKFLQKN